MSSATSPCFNMGAASDTYDLSLDTSGMPGDWNAYITDGVSNYSALSVTLAPGERAIYNVVMETGTPGGGKAVLGIHSQGNRTADRQLSYSAITPDTQVLLVDDDGADAFETAYYGPALATTGRSFATWDHSAAPLTGAILANFDVVVWNVGYAYPTLDAADRAAIGSYLDGGGALFVSGQDVGWELATQLGAPVLAWYRQYLHANFVLDDTNDYTLDGVAADPISNGMSIVIQGGDGANNQEYPDVHQPLRCDGSRDLQVRDDLQRRHRRGRGSSPRGLPGLRLRGDQHAGQPRAAHAAGDELAESGSDGRARRRVAVALRLEQNLPNPFNPKTTIRFSLPSAGAASLFVYDASGRRVATLLDGPQVAGAEEVVWNGRDDAGNPLATGMYFYRLQHASGEQTRKMLLLK